jgi:dienelactone hydrolase
MKRHNEFSIRAVYQAATIEHADPPHNTLQLKIYYPASEPAESFDPLPRGNSTNFPYSPFPVVIFFSGVNCSQESYRWLAMTLVPQGFVVVTFDWVAPYLPGMVGLTPGVNVKALASDIYGSVPTAIALPTILQALDKIQAEGSLAGKLNLDQLILGGHSAGGRVALESASPRFFDKVVAAFAYGAHTAAGPSLGFSPGQILPLTDQLPLLLMGGSCDGLIHKNGKLYGVTWASATEPIERTFNEGLQGGRHDNYLLILNGANHFAMTDPVDPTANMAFLDDQGTQPSALYRQIIGDILGIFLATHIDHDLDALAQLTTYLQSDNPLIQQMISK